MLSFIRESKILLIKLTTYDSICIYDFMKLHSVYEEEGKKY